MKRRTGARDDLAWVRADRNDEDHGRESGNGRVGPIDDVVPRGRLTILREHFTPGAAATAGDCSGPMAVSGMRPPRRRAWWRECVPVALAPVEELAFLAAELRIYAKAGHASKGPVEAVAAPAPAVRAVRVRGEGLG